MHNNPTVKVDIIVAFQVFSVKKYSRLYFKKYSKKAFVPDIVSGVKAFGICCSADLISVFHISVF